MPVSLSEAARLTGRSRNTLIRAIKAGKLKAPRGENGDWAIDEVELTKIFPPAGPSSDRLEAENRELRAQLEDLRRDRDSWRGVAERLAAKGE
jgi:hypothetical protein